jgi:hypothetical protein
MKSFLRVFAAVVLCLVARQSWANDSRKAGDAPDAASIIFDYKKADAVLNQQPQAAFTESCPASGIVVFSAVGEHHVSSGGLTLLGYSGTYESVGGGWTPGGGTFIAPCRGLYFFSISFVKDAYYYGGTTDDVYVTITRNGVGKGYAWSGAGDGSRSTGTYSVSLLLEAGDYVQTFVSSDGGGATRHLARYNFTGHLVRPY